MEKYPYAVDGHFRDFGKYFIYATNWGALFTALAITLDAILVLARYFVQARTRNDKPHYEKSHFMLQFSMGLTAISYPWVMGVTLVYYSALYDWNQPFILCWDRYLDFYVHFIITLLALIDTFISSRPWNLWHAWYV